MINNIKETGTRGQLHVALVLIFVGIFSQQAFTQAERRYIREGNRLYHKEQFDESELSYRRALEKDEESPGARFNLGNSLYKQERFDEALRYFGELAEDIDDPLNRSKVFHNLGNTMLMTQQLEQSIEAYKEALRNNPHDQETRYNLAFAQHLLDEMEQQEQDGEDSQDGDDQDQEGEDNDQTADQQDQDGDDRDRDRDQGDDQQQQEQDQAPQPRPDQISPEEALRMLEAAEREDQRIQEKLMEQKESGQQPRTGRNW